MMDQTHIGYRSWNDPKTNLMPDIFWVPQQKEKRSAPLFVEKDGYLSIEAEHYTRCTNDSLVKWIVIPNLGRTLSGVTTSPCTVVPSNKMVLQYDFETAFSGEAKVYLRFSPTLNFNDNKGLRYAVSFDGEQEQIVNINGNYRGELGKWQAEHVITTVTVHRLFPKDRHTLKVRFLDPALVLQKVMIDFGGLKPSFLGPPESICK